MFDVVIIGAGLAGSVLAERFTSRRKKVLVIERRKVVAGNCYDEVDANRILIHNFHRVKAVIDGKLYP